MPEPQQIRPWHIVKHAGSPSEIPKSLNDAVEIRPLNLPNKQDDKVRDLRPKPKFEMEASVAGDEAQTTPKVESEQDVISPATGSVESSGIDPIAPSTETPTADPMMSHPSILSAPSDETAPVVKDEALETIQQEPELDIF